VNSLNNSQKWPRLKTFAMFFLVGTVAFGGTIICFGPLLLVLVILDARAKQWARSLGALAGYCFALVALVVVMSIGPMTDDLSHRVGFNSGKWKDSITRENNEPVRLRMVDDLLAHVKLKGMSKVEVNELFGVPPHTEYFKKYDYVYWLGPERGAFSIDSEWLCIKFKNDIVDEVRVCRD